MLIGRANVSVNAHRKSSTALFPMDPVFGINLIFVSAAFAIAGKNITGIGKTTLEIAVY